MSYICITKIHQKIVLKSLTKELSEVMKDFNVVKKLDLTEEISIDGFYSDGSKYEYRINTQFNVLTNLTATLTTVIANSELCNELTNNWRIATCHKTGQDLLACSFNINDITPLLVGYRELEKLHETFNSWINEIGLIKIEIFWVKLPEIKKNLENYPKLYS